MKAFRLILSFRFFAIIDILFTEKFELKTYKDNTQRNYTTFCKKEIIEAGKKGLL